MPVSPVSRTAAAVIAEPSHSGSELPSVPETAALAHNPIQISTPSASLGSQADGPALSGSSSNHPHLQHSMHSTGQADSVSNGAEPQQSVHSTSQQPAIPKPQLLQDQTGEHPDLHPSQPVSIPITSHSGIAAHSHPEVPSPQQLPSSSPDAVTGSKLNSLAGSDTSNHTISVSDSPGGVAGTSGPTAAGEGPLVQQQPQQQQQQQQLSGEALASAETTPGDDSEKAPANQSTAARQPPPVAVPRVPLKKGEIAESFRTLVKQVTWPHNLHPSVGAVKERLHPVSLAWFWHAVCYMLSVLHVCGPAWVGSW